MNSKKAYQILKALVQGLDPDSGRELLAESVLQRAHVLRAMLTAIDALKEQSARQARRATLPERVGAPWTAEEERRLVELFQAGTGVSDIAGEFSRTVRSVEARLERLGLMQPGDRTTGQFT
jgi:DNA-binding NarL/FixJ family response regulator